jgi:hypothetical protein
LAPNPPSLLADSSSTPPERSLASLPLTGI